MYNTIHNNNDLRRALAGAGGDRAINILCCSRRRFIMLYYTSIISGWFNVPYPFRRQEVHSFGDLIAEHNEFVRRQRTRPVRIRVVVDAARIPQHALEFAQFRVLHHDKQGICMGETTNKLQIIIFFTA